MADRLSCATVRAAGEHQRGSGAQQSTPGLCDQGLPTSPRLRKAPLPRSYHLSQFGALRQQQRQARARDACAVVRSQHHKVGDPPIRGVTAIRDVGELDVHSAPDTPRVETDEESEHESWSLSPSSAWHRAPTESLKTTREGLPKTGYTGASALV